MAGAAHGVPAGVGPPGAVFAVAQALAASAAGRRGWSRWEA